MGLFSRWSTPSYYELTDDDFAAIERGVDILYEMYMKMFSHAHSANKLMEERGHDMTEAKNRARVMRNIADTLRYNLQDIYRDGGTQVTGEVAACLGEMKKAAHMSAVAGDRRIEVYRALDATADELGMNAKDFLALQQEATAVAKDLKAVLVRLLSESG